MGGGTGGDIVEMKRCMFPQYLPHPSSPSYTPLNPFLHVLHPPASPSLPLRPPCPSLPHKVASLVPGFQWCRGGPRGRCGA